MLKKPQLCSLNARYKHGLVDDAPGAKKSGSKSIMSPRQIEEEKSKAYA
jgi:hypothetical protein